MRKHRQVYFLKLGEQDEFEEYEPVENDAESSERQVIEQAGFTQHDLLLLLLEIPDHYRIVFNLYVIEGYQHSEIASLLNIAVGTSKSNLARARKRITELLYQKALERKKDRKKAAVTLMSISMLFVDGLFKNTFAQQQILPKKMPEKLHVTIQRASFKGGSVSTVIRLKLILFGGIGLTVGTIILVLSFRKPEIPQNFSEEKIQNDSIAVVPVIKIPLPKIEKETRLPKTKKRYQLPPVSKKHNLHNDTIRVVHKVPVIVKKQVVVRDTVFIQKENEE